MSIKKLLVNYDGITISVRGGDVCIVSDSPNTIKIKEKDFGDTCVSEILNMSGIEFDTFGGLLSVPNSVFDRHFTETKSFKAEEIEKRKHFAIHYHETFASEQKSAPIEFVASLLEKADLPFIIEDKKLYIQR